MMVSRLFRVVRLGKLTRFAAFLRDRFETQARCPCKFWSRLQGQTNSNISTRVSNPSAESWIGASWR